MFYDILCKCARSASSTATKKPFKSPFGLKKWEIRFDVSEDELVTVKVYDDYLVSNDYSTYFVEEKDDHLTTCDILLREKVMSNIKK